MFASVSLAQSITVLPTGGRYLGYASMDQVGTWIVFADGYLQVVTRNVEGGKGVFWEGPAGKYGVIFVPPGEPGTVVPIITSVTLGPTSPVPPVVPPVVPPTTNFETQVKTALTKVDSSALSYKKNVAEVYATIANEAKTSPNSWDAANMVNQAKVRNTTALPSDALSKWAGFWPELAKAFVELKLAPEDLQGHIVAFEEVARVLNQ